MASIVHVTDKDMIEFHRLNGNDAFNFWRAGSKMKFTDFKVGDTLFFLAKGSERRREKGIIGYGKCRQITSCSFNTMWRKYGTLNGYLNKKSCAEAIIKVNKDKKMPEKMTCILLEEVAFFNSPVYLSEFNAKLSNKLESYTYIDKGNQCLSEKIILKAMSFGVDLWTSKLNEEEFNAKLYQDAIRQTCGFIYQKIKLNETKMIKQLMRKYNEAKTGEFINGSQADSLEWGKDTIINVPMLVNDFNKIQTTIGHITLFRKMLTDINPEYEKIIFRVLTQNIQREIETQLTSLNIEYKKLSN